MCMDQGDAPRSVTADASTPMPTTRSTSVTWNRAILDLVRWHGKPLAVDEHIHATEAQTIVRRSAVSIVTTTVAVSVCKIGVDVVRVGRRTEAQSQQSDAKEEPSWKHNKHPDHRVVLGRFALCAQESRARGSVAADYPSLRLICSST